MIESCYDDCINGCRGIVGGIEFLESLSLEELREEYECCKECMVMEELEYCRKRLKIE